jgi:branched-chain amino acid transport system permease protein
MTTRFTLAGNTRLRLLCVLVIAVVLILLPFVNPPFRVAQFTLALVYVMAILGLTMITGHAGQISMCQGAFLAIGAYTTAICIQKLHLPGLVTIPIAAAVTLVVGYGFGRAALRVRGVYLAVVTFSLAVVIGPLVTRLSGLTGGYQGMSVPKLTAPDWSGVADDQWGYLCTLVLVGVLAFLAYNLGRGRIGRALAAIRENELEARANGVNTARTKTWIFAWSAAFAGVAGAMYAQVIGYVSPDSFALLLSMQLLVGVVVGGTTYVSGAVLGGLFLVFVPIGTSTINPAWSGVIFAVALILIVFVARRGLIGFVLQLVRKLSPAPRVSNDPVPPTGTDAQRSADGAEPDADAPLADLDRLQSRSTL